MRILITGAAGLVASHLVTGYRGHTITALRHAELDITDPGAINHAVGHHRPDLIFNCAVIGVDDCQADPPLAERVNVTGPEQLAIAAERIGATIVHFSSNYVFDGHRTSGVPYTVDDDPQPINVYGTTKLQGERAVSAAATRAFIIRTSWVFGAGKNSFLSSVGARLAHRERVQAITDTFASTTYVTDLVARVMEVIERGHPGTYQLVNDGVCSYETFAREAARLLGLDDATTRTLIEPSTEASLARPAPRPRWTPMRCLLSERLGLPAMRPWHDALAAYLSRASS
ncbi:MAG TPA: dTDP-4-dehydrorhamnose reductase [Thermoanaerobaculia bacterium]|jgi:dTDP-4-dehydrorhamnose reductase